MIGGLKNHSPHCGCYVTYLVPGSHLAPLFMFELPVNVDRGVVEPVATRAGRASAGASVVLLVVVPQAKVGPDGPEGP